MPNFRYVLWMHTTLSVMYQAVNQILTIVMYSFLLGNQSKVRHCASCHWTVLFLTTELISVLVNRSDEVQPFVSKVPSRIVSQRCQNSLRLTVKCKVLYTMTLDTLIREWFISKVELTFFLRRRRRRRRLHMFTVCWICACGSLNAAQAQLLPRLRFFSPTYGGLNPMDVNHILIRLRTYT